MKQIKIILVLSLGILPILNCFGQSPASFTQVDFICEGPRRGDEMMEISHPLSCTTSTALPYDYVKSCTLLSSTKYLGEKPKNIEIKEQSQDNEKVILTGEKVEVVLNKSSFTAIVTLSNGGILECRKKK